MVEEASGQNVFHKLALGRRSAVDRYGERKTVISGDSNDFRALAATGGTNGEAPFLAPAKVGSTNASSRFSQQPQDRTNSPLRYFMRLVLGPLPEAVARLPWRYVEI
jgi:hypothetical protein